MSRLSVDEKQNLFRKAQEALQKSYSKYSQIKVGAAILTRRNNIFLGCNVENPSFGLTMCAEQVAIANAVIHEGGENLQVKAIMVVSEPKFPCSPCGACRQLIFEFGNKATVLFQGRENNILELPIHKLLPFNFQLMPNIVK